MSDYDSTRQRITSSVFAKLSASGQQEEYVAHLKIWEEEGDGSRKSRYIILSQSPDGGSIHKSKSNQNGTFSVGKTWQVTELRGVEVINPINFNITITRTYRWQTENPKEQLNFIAALIQLFHTVTQGSQPLNIRGFNISAAAAASTPRPQPIDPGNVRRMERAPTPPNGTPLPPASPRRPVANDRTNGHARNSSRSQRFDDSPSPAANTPPRSRRAATPAQSEFSDSPSRPPPVVVGTERPGTPSRTRPGTPSSQTSTIPPALRAGVHARRTSNVASTASAGSSMLAVAGAAPYRSATPPAANGAVKRATPQAPPISIPTRYNGVYANGTLGVPDGSSSSQPSPMSTYPSTPDNLSVPLPEQSLPLRKKPSRTPTMDPDTGQPRREQNARVSFYDPPNQATLNQLLSGDVVMYESIDDEGESTRVMEDTTAQATLDSMEEMLEGYEWATDDIMGRRSMTGAADRMEARLLDELMALDKANIHSFIESDDRVNIVLKFLEDAISELDSMDSVISSYKIHLNAVNEDIGFIQSQNRGLQVQIQNQRALTNELEELLQTVHVDKEALLALTQESLEKPASIQRLEGAATELYKALQASKDRDMAATFERLDEYRTHNAHFCKRVLEYLTFMITAQAKMLLGDTDGVVKSPQGRPSLMNHRTMETYLGRYGGLLLYLKEMDEGVYAKLCAAYFAAASGLHNTQVRALLSTCSSMIKETADDDAEGFGGITPTTTSSKAASGLRRAGTIARSPLEGRRGKKERPDGDMTAADALSLVLEEIASIIYHEEEFIADFLQINDAGLTFADYMGLENYFRRQAARFAGLSQATLKLMRGALDLIFGFLPTELKAWLDGAMSKDGLQIIGIVVALERFLGEAEERGNAFVLSLLEKQHVRLKGLFERRVNEQIKTIEDMRLTSKKRNGVAPFIKYFPVYIGRVETQLIGADTLEIRQTVDQAYDKIVQSMFDALKHMAKLDGEGEDKGQLNYHVILIENMHYFVAEVSLLQLGSVATFLKRAEAIYEENLNAYVKIVLRRPFFKLIDYFEGIERVLKTTAPSEVPSNSSYSKSALKKVVKEYNSKDVRKHIDSLFKRVEKHFTEASEKATSEDVSTGIASGTVMVGVWKACEDELLRITDLFVKRIDQCYKDMGVSLEYSAGDVQAAFKRHRVAA